MVTQSLDGGWEFTQAGRGAWMKAKVPGCNFTDLMANRRIPDPFVSDNEAKVQWVAASDWEYRRTFDVSQAVLSNERIYLECDGLDTIATLWLNGRRIGFSDNMFVPAEFEVKRLLKPRRNILRILFESPLKRKGKEGKFRIGSTFMLQSGPLTRKSPSQFGWDWGPKLPPAGVWRSIRLTGRSAARIGEVKVNQVHSGNRVTLKIAVGAEKFRRIPLRARFVLTHPSPRNLTQVSGSVLAPGAQSAEAAISVEDPLLWWPAGMGSQPLYDLTVCLETLDGRVLDSRVMRLGLRTKELRRRRDKWGESFTFMINGRPVFAKGANWIPADSFPSRLDHDWYRGLLKSAVEANMNMLRVWGGGLYEDEVFYDLCDEMGILVWQDFMFACNLYPANPEFYANVGREIEVNVRRLRHRACLVLWCGNNEIESGLTGGWWGKVPAGPRRNYYRMFNRFIPAIVKREDPATAYWPSSPSSGNPKLDPGDENRGDAHYWDVWHGVKPFTAYRKHFFRFMSEFGFQSIPPIETVATFAEKKDWNMMSRVMEHHQRNPAGNGLIVHYLTRNLRLPSSFKSLVYASQILQAEAMRFGVEHWRRNRARVSGALYWQINDCWPVLSWSSVDYFGRWKALHYSARRFYAPVLLSAHEKGLSASLHVTNDNLAAFRGTVRWRLETLSGRRITAGSARVFAKPLADTRVKELDFEKLVSPQDKPNVVLVYELFGRGAERVSGGVCPFIADKHLELSDPGIRVAAGKKGKAVILTLKSKFLARFVELKLRGVDAAWSDNFFDLPARTTRRITCTLPSEKPLSWVRSRLEINSLWHSYQERTRGSR